MAILEIPFVGTPVVSRERRVHAQRLINYDAVKQGEGALSPIAFYTRPGLSLFCSAGLGPCRSNGVRFDDKLFFVSGGELVSLSASGVVTSIGTLDTTGGRVVIADPGRSYILLTDGVSGYYYGGTPRTFGKVVDVNFPTCNFVAHLRGYFIAMEVGTDTFYVSTNYDDPTAWSSLGFASAERKPDKAVSMIVHDDTLWIVGEYTSEGFYMSGDSTFPFAPIMSMPINWGTLAPHSIAASEARIYWLAHGSQGGNVVMAASRQGVQPVSPPELSYQIGQLSSVTDAEAHYYIMDGTGYYVLTFPTGDATWVYNEGLGLWSERKSFGTGRWRVSGYGYLDGAHIVGDYANSLFYKLDRSAYTDNGGIIERTIVSNPMMDSHRMLMHNSVEVIGKVGVGLASGQGVAPEYMLRWSDDGGYTWGPWIRKSIGVYGDRTARVRWLNLGSSRERVYELKATDPVDVVTLKAIAEVEAGLL